MSQGNGSVLVVEDDAEINALVGAYAELCGLSYRSALDGTSGISEARSHPPSAVILDIMLPDIDGFEVCRRMRADPDLSRVPIIFLSALSGEKDIAHGRECGANAYLTKPFDPDKLIATLKEHAKNQSPR